MPKSEKKGPEPTPGIPEEEEADDVQSLLIHRCDIYRRSYVADPLAGRAPKDDCILAAAPCRFVVKAVNEIVSETAEVMRSRYSAFLAGSLSVEVRHDDLLRNFTDRNGNVIDSHWFAVKAIARKGQGRLTYFELELEKVS